MKKQTIFTGAATAIITPFTENGVDWNSFADLIDWQIASGINAIVVAGTTGEGPTLTDEEHQEVLKFAVERIAGRVPTIAGTGSNDTAYAIELSQHAKTMGYDGLLLVTPYYNKATQKGLVASFNAVADAVKLPCILYNVPGRTGCNLSPESTAELAKNPYITSIKEASGDISQVAKISALCGDQIDIYSGNDDQIVPLLSLGGKGVISVLSNIMPAETVKICDSWFKGDVQTAKELQLKYLALINQLFAEVNPIPVKAALAAMGKCKNILRLPLTPMEAAHETKLLELMKEQNLI